MTIGRLDCFCDVNLSGGIFSGLNFSSGLITSFQVPVGLAGIKSVLPISKEAEHGKVAYRDN